MTLRFQYAWLLGSLIVVAVLGTSLCMDLAERRFLRRGAAQRDQLTLTVLGQITKDALLTDDDLLLIDYAQLLKQNHPEMAYVAIINPAGLVLAHSDPQWLGQPASAQRLSPDVLTRRITITLGGQPAATASFGVWRAVREREIAQAAAQARRWIWGIGAGMVSLALLAGCALAWSITSPIQRLEQAAEAVGAGHLDCHIDLRRQDELGRLASSFNTMVDRLGELNRLKEGFVQAVTHELRSPLGAISSFIQLMLTEAQRPSDTLIAAWVGYLHRMKANTERLTRFVNDILDVAKLEEQKVECRLEPCDPYAVVTDVVGLFQAQAHEHQLTLTAAEPTPRVLILADVNHLHHILTNLLSNALKFTPPGGTIHVRTAPDDRPLPGAASAVPRWVHISVADTGMGIPREAQEAIFDKFHQIPGSRVHIKGPKGTGLGLTIAKTLTELQGGHIAVESTPGEGSRFTVILPVYDPRSSGQPGGTTP